MKHIKRFKLNEKRQGLTPEKINWINSCLNGNKTSWSINEVTGRIDILGDFNCTMERLHQF